LDDTQKKAPKELAEALWFQVLNDKKRHIKIITRSSLEDKANIQDWSVEVALGLLLCTRI